MYAIFRAFLVIVAALFCFSSTSSSSNFQSQLKIVNFTYNFRVGQNAMRRRDRQGNKKKKVAIKIFARLCHIGKQKGAV